MAGAFGTTDWMRQGVLVTTLAGTSEPGMPAKRLYNEQPGRRARFTGGAVTFVVDLLTPRNVGIISLINTTATGAESFVIRGSLTDPTGASGVIFSKTITPSLPNENRGQIVCFLSFDVSVRYVRVQITGIVGGFFDIGVMSIQKTLRLAHGFALGAQRGRVPLGSVERNPLTGREFRVGADYHPRFMRFMLPSVIETEYDDTFRTMIAEARVTDDFSWVPETTLAQNELNKQVIFGGLVRPGEEMSLTQDFLVFQKSSFTIVERM